MRQVQDTYEGYGVGTITHTRDMSKVQDPYNGYKPGMRPLQGV